MRIVRMTHAACLCLPRERCVKCMCCRERSVWQSCQYCFLLFLNAEKGQGNKVNVVHTYIVCVPLSPRNGSRGDIRGETLNTTALKDAIYRPSQSIGSVATGAHLWFPWTLSDAEACKVTILL